MNIPTVEELTRKQCSPCEGGVPPLGDEEARAFLDRVEGWDLTPDATRIRRAWTARNFMAAIDFFNKIATLAEQEGHHPDLHLEGYRRVTVELWTHAAGGLTENDFILASKINHIPISLRK